MHQPKREQPSTYFMQDRESQEELKRLQVFDHMLTTGMGGVLPEQPDPTAFPRVLDVGCGAGGWLIELAKMAPNCQRLVGVDVSRTFVGYARAQAKEAGVADRVEFHVMDALRMLEFPDHSFDLVNHRSAVSWLRTWDWAKLLQEYQRVCRSDGVVRVTEPTCWVSNSPSSTQIIDFSTKAFYQAGYWWNNETWMVTDDLTRLFVQHGIQKVQARNYMLEFRHGTPEWQSFFDNFRIGMRVVVPFLRKWIRVPDNYDELYQQALIEMQQPDFVANWNLITVWGNA